MWGRPPNPFSPQGGGMLPDARQLPMMAAAVQEQPKRPGWHGIAGIIADALAGGMGRQGMYAPTMLKQRMMEMEDRREAMKEERERNKPIRTEIDGSYVEIDPRTGSARTLYKGQPKLDDLGQDLMRAGIDPNSEAARPYYKALVERKTAPPMQSVPGFDEQGNPVLRFLPRTAPGAAPTATSKAEYDALPPGSPYVAPDGTRRIKGGAGPQAPRTFP